MTIVTLFPRETLRKVHVTYNISLNRAAPTESGGEGVDPPRFGCDDADELWQAVFVRLRCDEAKKISNHCLPVLADWPIYHPSPGLSGLPLTRPRLGGFYIIPHDHFAASHSRSKKVAERRNNICTYEQAAWTGYLGRRRRDISLEFLDRRRQRACNRDGATRTPLPTSPTSRSRCRGCCGA